MSVNSARHKERRDLAILTLFLMIMVIIGTIFYHTVEKFSLVDSIYLTSVTLTTVGYGDLAPLTDEGKIFTSVFSFIGIGTFLAFAAAFLRATLERLNK